jgi:DNA-binding NtrC family response regulator
LRRANFAAICFIAFSVVPVAMPPLRERREDFETLARVFLARHGAPGAEIAPDALAALRRIPGGQCART